MSETTDLVVTSGGFVLSPDEVEIVRDNMGDDFSPWDLDSVKVPSGGSQVWEVETLDGVDVAKTLDGVIVHSYTHREYWVGEFGDTEGPPSCRSNDGKTGVGNPGGVCRACPFAAFGSGKGNAQACKTGLRLYVLQPGNLIPIEVNLSPTSIKPAQKYFLQLMKHKLSRTHVVTSIGLKRVTRGGYTYSVATFSVARRLTADEFGSVKEFSSFFGNWVSDSLSSLGTSEAVVAPEVGGGGGDAVADYDEDVPF